MSKQEPDIALFKNLKSGLDETKRKRLDEKRKKFEAEKQEIESWYKLNLKSIQSQCNVTEDDLAEDTSKNGEKRPKKRGLRRASKAERYGGLKEKVIEIIKNYGNQQRQFTINEIRADVSKSGLNFPRTSVATAFRRLLADDKSIVTIKTGKGKAETIFAKK